MKKLLFILLLTIPFVGLGQVDTIKTSQNVNPEIMNDVLMALDSLGYKDQDVASLVKKQILAGSSSSSEIIKNVLREL